MLQIDSTSLAPITAPTTGEPKNVRRRLRILVHGLNFAPDLIGIAKYTTEMAHWFAGRGHEVRVVTAPPYYPSWTFDPGYSALSHQREQHGTIIVQRCPLWVPKQPSGVKRLIHLGSFAMSSLYFLLKEAVAWRPDVVWTVAPALFAAPVASLAARACNALSCIHLQDFEVDAAFELGLLKGRHSRAAALAIERTILRQFSLVTSISPQMVRQLTDGKRCDPSKVALIRNWVDTDAIRPLNQPSRFRRELGIGPDQVVALYSGNMGAKQGLSIIIEAARQLAAHPNIRFVLCGEGPAKAELTKAAAGLPNVTFLPLQPINALNELLNLADLHLLPQLASAADLVLPSKLTGMLASGRPVIATVSPGTGIANEIEDAGLITLPGDLAAFTNAILSLADHPETKRVMGDVARQRAMTHWDRDNVLGEFEDLLLSRVQGSERSIANA